MSETSKDSNVQNDLLRGMRAQMAAVTGGIAPDDYAQAWWDWYLNLAKSPHKQIDLANAAVRAFTDNITFATQATLGQSLAASAEDKRFSGASWQHWPFNVLARGYLNWEDLMHQSTSNVPGMKKRSAELVRFSTRQITEGASPANNLASNPELLELTRQQSGRNLIEGFKNWLEDVGKTLTQQRSTGSDAFKVGRDVAVTPGKIVYRNRLIEVIQYAASTEFVHAEPILITPAWIMKYYILDLSPANSLVRYLVDKGHTVFMISWKNPTEDERNLGMDDYYSLGIQSALNVVRAIVPGVKIHGVGYCIGGTLLSIAAAAMARDGDDALASMTLFAAQTDFSEPGELALFISPSQLSMLEAMMHKTGTLSSEQMGAAFSLLRANDLLWTPAINAYVKGKRPSPNDLMSWNADGTRMPWRMHSEYLQHLYLQNDLAEGRFRVNDVPVDLKEVTVPMFILGTETDHVAPWHSTFKTRLLTRSEDYTYLLTSGGHNGGIVCGPVNPKRRFRERTWTDAHTCTEPNQWFSEATLHQGSWWPYWQNWVAMHSSRSDALPPSLGNADAGFGIMGDAPGDYVAQR